MRLDQYLLERGYFKSRSKAQEAIEQSNVIVDGNLCLKASFKIKEGSVVQIDAGKQYVSRSGHKLEAAMEHFGVSADGKVCLDVGSSTGGFTQCLLDGGAKQVFAVDVGTDQMDSSLATDGRVELYENTDIRNFQLPDGKKCDLVVVDVSFVSLRKILPALSKFLVQSDNVALSSAQILMLFKPQFEVGKSKLKKGIYRDVDMDQEIMAFSVFAREAGFFIHGVFEVPLKGKKGNQEYFLLASFLKA